MNPNALHVLTRGSANPNSSNDVQGDTTGGGGIGKMGSAVVVVVVVDVP